MIFMDEGASVGQRVRHGRGHYLRGPVQTGRDIGMRATGGPPARLERATQALGGPCSIRLSYGGARHKR